MEALAPRPGVSAGLICKQPMGRIHTIVCVMEIAFSGLLSTFDMKKGAHLTTCSAFNFEFMKNYDAICTISRMNSGVFCLPETPWNVHGREVLFIRKNCKCFNIYKSEVPGL